MLRLKSPILKSRRNWKKNWNTSKLPDLLKDLVNKDLKVSFKKSLSEGPENPIKNINFNLTSRQSRKLWTRRFVQSPSPIEKNILACNTKVSRVKKVLKEPNSKVSVKSIQSVSTKYSSDEEKTIENWSFMNNQQYWTTLHSFMIEQVKYKIEETKKSRFAALSSPDVLMRKVTQVRNRNLEKMRSLSFERDYDLADWKLTLKKNKSE